MVGLFWSIIQLKVGLVGDNTHSRLLVTNIAFYTGTRLGEVVQLTTSDIE